MALFFAAGGGEGVGRGGGRGMESTYTLLFNSLPRLEEKKNCRGEKSGRSFLS